ncbi:vitelline membrane outer layer protein 1-like [Alosa pseudoharengus]|uniref:vitelline membrane outer layer protein 1-like n=1 Tax=Alosa pseudoharengus TaxID=34774 RepID=UPI003F8AADC2
MSLIFGLLVILPLAFPAEGSLISVTNGGRWGRWGGMTKCPCGYRAIGFCLKVERAQGGGDDTALNSIGLLCKHTQTRSILPYGRWGRWTPAKVCRNDGYLTSFRLRVERPQGGGDDTAANNIVFRCSTGEVLTGAGMHWGTWGGWSGQCSGGRGICGVQMKVERPQGWGDDTALNDVRFQCCQ